jgi:hypothetical protein
MTIVSEKLATERLTAKTFGLVFIAGGLIGGGFKIADQELPQLTDPRQIICLVAAGLGLFFFPDTEGLLRLLTVVVIVGAAVSWIAIVFLQNRGSSLIELPGREISVSASSVLPSSGSITYKPENTLDGRRDTAWNDGVEGSGVDEELSYVFKPKGFKLNYIEIINGYTKQHGKCGYLFEQNHRVKGLEIRTDNGTFQYELRDTDQPQQIRLSFGTTRSLTLRVKSIYKGRGDCFAPDLAVSEVSFYGRLTN